MRSVDMRRVGMRILLRILISIMNNRYSESYREYISGYRCIERIKAKTDGSNRLTYTGLSRDLTIETSESFECVMGLQSLLIDNR